MSPIMGYYVFLHLSVFTLSLSTSLFKSILVFPLFHFQTNTSNSNPHHLWGTMLGVLLFLNFPIFCFIIPLMTLVLTWVDLVSRYFGYFLHCSFDIESSFDCIVVEDNILHWLGFLVLCETPLGPDNWWVGVNSPVLEHKVPLQFVAYKISYLESGSGGSSLQPQH